MVIGVVYEYGTSLHHAAVMHTVVWRAILHTVCKSAGLPMLGLHSFCWRLPWTHWTSAWLDQPCYQSSNWMLAGETAAHGTMLGTLTAHCCHWHHSFRMDAAHRNTDTVPSQADLNMVLPCAIAFMYEYLHYITWLRWTTQIKLLSCMSTGWGVWTGRVLFYPAWFCWGNVHGR